MACNGILTGHMVITKAMLDELTLKHCEGTYEWNSLAPNNPASIMVPYQTNGYTNVHNFFSIGSNRTGTPSYFGPWAVRELLKGARHSMGFGEPEDLPDFRLSLSKVLYAIRMPHLMAAKIQRKYRNWKSCDPEGAMLMISCSNDLEDTVAMIERDGKHMADKHDRSCKTKIALKKTIVKKSKTIETLTKERLDDRRLPITEMIYADLLRLCPGVARGKHPDITIRFNLHGSIHAQVNGGDRFDDPYCELDCNEISGADANSGAHTVRAAIEAGLDERCRSLRYSGLEPWDGGEDRVCVYVVWK
jgi:hypothetical protein